MNSEYTVGNVDEFNDGQMKQVVAGETKVLLVRIGGQLRAYGAECPHHGAPLDEGLFAQETIRCPWHQAVFNALTGEMIEPPALDDLPLYDVHIRDGQVIVSVPETPPRPRIPRMARSDTTADGRTFAIAGGGAAGLAAAEALRQNGFCGKVVVITAEADVSYDRTELSKGYLGDRNPKSPTLRPMDFFARNGIELWTGRNITEIRSVAKMVGCGDGTELGYDRLLLATGGLPRRLGVPGEDLQGVMTLRSFADARALRKACDNAQRAVIVGGGFIGMEVAASLIRRGIAVTVVMHESAPFLKVFGEQIGGMFLRLHEKKGTMFRLGGQVERFEGDGHLEAVILEGGERLPADLALVGVGIRLVSDILKDVPLNDDGSVSVDRYCRAGDAMFAAGDIARMPDWRSGKPFRCEHWRWAQQQGRLAARAMLDQPLARLDVPFFWTTQFKTSLQYVGHAGEWDEIVIDGDVEQQSFVAYYLKSGLVLAAAGCGQDLKLAAIAERMVQAVPPDLNTLRAS